MEERKPLYFRDGALGMKQFQGLSNSQQKEYVDTLFKLEVEERDFRDNYILSFFGKFYFPEYFKKEDNKKFISMERK